MVFKIDRFCAFKKGKQKRCGDKAFGPLCVNLLESTHDRTKRDCSRYDSLHSDHDLPHEIDDTISPVVISDLPSSSHS